MKPSSCLTLLPVLVLAVACASDPEPTTRPTAASFGPEARFDVTHDLDVTVPAGARRVRIWFARPGADPAQQVADWRVESGVPVELTEGADGNRFVYADLVDPPAGIVHVGTRFTLARKEVKHDLDPAKTRPLDPAERARLSQWLQPSRYVIIDDRIRTLAAEITAGETNPIRASRLIYDWVLHDIEYWVKEPSRLKASPVGSTDYCLTTKTGNCTDFHSLYTSLSRAAGIPTRMVYGSLFKSPLDGVDQDQSYHCWPDFWAPGYGWIPLDVAVADIFDGPIAIDDQNRDKVALTVASGYAGPDPRLVDYYFGNLDERRVTWNIGRDLTLAPPQAGGPVNAIPKAHVEIDGVEWTDWKRKLTYREVR